MYLRFCGEKFDLEILDGAVLDEEPPLEPSAATHSSVSSN